jgi:hypothetical protein
MKGTGNNQHTKQSNAYNVREATCGNSRSYTVSRLQREAPDPRARGANFNLTPTEGHGN